MRTFTVEGFHFGRDEKLLHDYIHNFSKVSRFYQYDPAQKASWEKTIDSVMRRTYQREKLADILEKQNVAFNSGDRTMAKISRLRERTTCVVVTGQQAGILTGPLYTIYKALTVIKLSEKLKAGHGIEVVPIFWIAADDHDFSEVNHIFVLQRDGSVSRFVFNPTESVEARSVGTILLDRAFDEFLTELESFFPDSEFKPTVFELIRSSYKEGLNLGSGFGRMLAKLSQNYGLILVDPLDPELRKLVLPIWQEELHNPTVTTRLAESAGEDLEAEGYRKQVEKSSISTSLFFGDSQRRRITFEEDFFSVEGTKEKFSQDEILRLLNEHTYKFSSNVLLRPVGQDYIFPTLAYVAGPGEISYFAQLRSVYEHFTVPMPVIYPRVSFTILEGRVQKTLEKNSLPVEKLFTNPDELFGQLVRERSVEHWGILFDSSKEKIKAVLDEVASQLVTEDPGLKNLVEATVRSIDHHLNVLQDKAFQSERKRNEVLKDQIRKACVSVFPEGRFQERTFNIVQYLTYYGTSLIDQLYSAIDLDNFKHIFVEI